MALTLTRSSAMVKRLSLPALFVLLSPALVAASLWNITRRWILWPGSPLPRSWPRAAS